MSAAGARIEGADDEVRALLAPAAARIARLADLVDAIADGNPSEEAAVDALESAVDELNRLAADQPVRRPR